MLSGTVFADFLSKESQFGPMGRMRLGVMEEKRGKNGIKKETCWISVVVYGKMATLCNELNIKRGSRLMIRGKLKLNEWEQEGVKRSQHTVIAEEIAILAGCADGKDSEELAWHM